MEMNFGCLILIQTEVKFHFTSLSLSNIQPKNEDPKTTSKVVSESANNNNQEPSKCLLALFSLKIGKSHHNFVA